MDPTAALKSEVFRPFTSIIIPGGIAIAPYFFVAHQKYPGFDGILEHSGIVAVVGLLLVTVAAGLVLENLGSIIEAKIWDPMLEKRTGVHDDDWVSYLARDSNNEPVGQKYLRSILLRMKFETATGISIVIGWFGIAWLNAIRYPVLFQPLSFAIGSLIALFVAAYLIFESGQSCRVLSDTRHIMLHGIRPKELKADDEEEAASGLLRDLLASVSVLFVTYGTIGGLVVVHLWTSNGPANGAVGALCLIVAGLVFGALAITDASGRMREVALRSAFACGLIVVLLFLLLIEGGPHWLESPAILWFAMAGSALRSIGLLLPKRPSIGSQTGRLGAIRRQPKDAAESPNIGANFGEDRNENG